MSSTLTANDTVASGNVTVASGFKRYRLAGVQIASLEQQQAAQEQTRENFSQALQDGRLDVSKLGSPSSPVIPVYVDDDGQQFLGIPTALGPRMSPLENAVPFDHQGNPTAGGFWSADAMNQLKNAPGAGNPQAMASMMTQAAQQVLPQHVGSDGASLVESLLTTTGMGLGQQLASEGLSMLAGASNPNGLLNQFVSTGSDVNLAQLGQNLASGMIGNLMNMGIQAAMSNWQVDDESSTAEHVAQQAAQALIGKLQAEVMGMVNKELTKAFGTATKDQLTKSTQSADDSPTMAEKIKEFFAGPTSTANVPVGRIGDADTNDGFAVMGATTVLANGLKVTRYGDGVTMTNPSVDLGPLQSGNPVVLTCTLPTAGKGHVAVGLSKGIVTLLDSCSPNVFMGPQGMPDVKPTPKRDLDKAAAEKAAVEKAAAEKAAAEKAAAEKAAAEKAAGQNMPPSETTGDVPNDQKSDRKPDDPFLAWWQKLTGDDVPIPGTATPLIVDEDGQIAGCNEAYNCHSYAWHDGNGDPAGDPTSQLPGNPYWDNSNQNEIASSQPVVGPAEPGDIIDYGGNHSAIVTEVDSNGSVTQAVSKWGQSSVYYHNPGSVPPSYGPPTGIYRPDEPVCK